MGKGMAVLAAMVAAVNFSSGVQQPTPPARTTNLGSDPNGNPLRLAPKTGHVSNYDEAKVKPFTLPDPLVMDSTRSSRRFQSGSDRRDAGAGAAAAGR